jgi:hypothetical protein
MARQVNIPATFLQRAVTPVIVCMGLTFAGMNVSQAAQAGHGRLFAVLDLREFLTWSNQSL